MTTNFNETRIAPHAVEAEEAVLGSILINPEVLLDVNWFLEAGDFFIVRHQQQACPTERQRLA